MVGKPVGDKSPMGTAVQHFAAFFPPSPPKQVREGRCELGAVDAGEVDIYYPTLGTDSLERERIITHAISNNPVDEPDLGDGAFSVRNSPKDSQVKAERVAIKAWFDDLD